MDQDLVRATIQNIDLLFEQPQIENPVEALQLLQTSKYLLYALIDDEEGTGEDVEQDDSAIDVLKVLLQLAKVGHNQPGYASRVLRKLRPQLAAWTRQNTDQELPVIPENATLEDFRTAADEIGEIINKAPLRLEEGFWGIIEPLSEAPRSPTKRSRSQSRVRFQLPEEPAPLGTHHTNAELLRQLEDARREHAADNATWANQLQNAQGAFQNAFAARLAAEDQKNNARQELFRAQAKIRQQEKEIEQIKENHDIETQLLLHDENLVPALWRENPRP